MTELNGAATGHGRSASTRVPPPGGGHERSAQYGTAIFTPGQIARMLLVSPRTVSQWVDKGLLRGWRIPGSNDRRVYRADLLEFLRRHDMPVPARLLAARLVLLAGLPERLVRHLWELLPPAEDYLIAEAETAFGAVRALARHPAAAVVVDFAGVGRADGLGLGRDLRRELPRALLVALCNEDEGDEREVSLAGYGVAFRRPFDPAAVAEAVKGGVR